jgi:hypothetical protein
MHVYASTQEVGRISTPIEFTYNNGFHESLKMSPFEVLYGRKCKVPINWDNSVDRITLGHELLKEMEHAMITIRKNMKIAQDRKDYADRKRTQKEFKVGDHVYI